jgi:hypothetical protein
MGQGKLVSTDHTDKWPRFLQQIAKNSQHNDNEWQPEIIEMDGHSTEEKLKDFLKDKNISRIIDSYDEQYAELMVSRQPKLYQSSYEEKRQHLDTHIAQHHTEGEPWQKGSWVYYPWNGELIHILGRELFLELRSIRNRDLITVSEQRLFAEFNVGCMGMSVGSNAALALALQGGSQKLKIADGAVISTSNLNRVLAGINTVGLSKSLIVARKLYEMNPYISLDRYDTNIDATTIVNFFEKPWPIDVIVDEMDDLKVKILLRIEARKRRLPVLMATDLGDDVMLDVERYDLDPNLSLFHGLAGNIENLLNNEVDRKEWIKHATAIVGPANASIRMQESLMKVGRDLPTQPQLGGTAMMAGATIAYAVRKLALGENLKSGRTMISLDGHLIDDYHTPEQQNLRRESTKKLEEAFQSLH